MIPHAMINDPLIHKHHLSPHTMQHKRDVTGASFGHDLLSPTHSSVCGSWHFGELIPFHVTTPLIPTQILTQTAEAASQTPMKHLHQRHRHSHDTQISRLVSQHVLLHSFRFEPPLSRHNHHPHIEGGASRRALPLLALCLLSHSATTASAPAIPRLLATCHYRISSSSLIHWS